MSHLNVYKTHGYKMLQHYGVDRHL
jgi:hypothetical protein